MYKITITADRQITGVTKREWIRGGPDEATKDGYGYTPQVPEIRNVTETVLEMSAETMDVTSVVRAILDNTTQPERSP